MRHPSYPKQSLLLIYQSNDRANQDGKFGFLSLENHAHLPVQTKFEKKKWCKIYVNLIQS